MLDVSRFDVVIVGGGPAGLAAARAASTETSSVAIIDQGSFPGGQIWRRDVATAKPSHPAAVVPERATFIDSASVLDAVNKDGRYRLFVEQQGRALTIESATIILATGARELFLPFPGWTLPGVVGVGGLQALMKSGFDVRGRRIVIAGSGPLLLAVAAAAADKGAEVVAVAEQASVGALAGFALQIATRPAIAFNALRYAQRLNGGVLHFGKWVERAHGVDRVTSVTLAPGNSETKIECDLLCTGYGLVPNTELARRLGCAVTDAGVVVDDRQCTTVPGVYAAGECAGVGGVEKAYAEGLDAGYVAGGRTRSLASAATRRRAASWTRTIARTFAPRREVLSLARSDTIICRCEDVRLADLGHASSPREAKLYSRVGMGACQGRVCGAALQCMFGWASDTVRPPLQPTTVSSLLGAS